ncbi:MAG: EamA family transporter [Rhodobacterales bacterium]|nr:MAG: EamA family transporter [Rhodobacterales bacterium]
MDNLRGALLMIFAMAGFAIEDVFIKKATVGLPIGEVLVILGFFGGLGFAGIAYGKGICILSRSFFHPMVLLRNTGELLGTTAYVTALTLIPLSLLGALLQASPIFVTLGAIVFYRERVGWRRWTAILTGFAGVLIILNPGLDGFNPLALIGILAAFGLAWRDLASRARPAHVHPLQLASWGFASIVPIGAAMMWIDGGRVTPDLWQWGLLIGALISGMAGYFALILSVEKGDIAFVIPFRYSRLIFAIGFGLILFGERPDAPTLIGATIVVGSGLYMLLRERRQMQKAPFPPRTK